MLEPVIGPYVALEILGTDGGWVSPLPLHTRRPWELTSPTPFPPHPADSQGGEAAGPGGFTVQGAGHQPAAAG